MIKLFKKFLEDYEYHSLHFGIYGNLAKKITDFGKSIPDELINSAAGGREKYPHITCKYGLVDSISRKLVDLLIGTGSVKVTFGPITRFENENCDVLKIDIISADIRRLNKLIVSNMKCVDTFTEYHPHLTIAYMNRGSVQPYLLNESRVDNKKFLGKQLIFDTITFASKDRLEHTISLN